MPLTSARCSTEPPPSAEIAQRHRAQQLITLIKSEFSAGTRGQPGDRGEHPEQFREISHGWLFHPHRSEDFQERHQPQVPSLGQEHGGPHESVSASKFLKFIRNESVSLAEQYLDSKSRGFTACEPVSDEVHQGLVRSAGGLSSIRGNVSHHAFNLAIIDYQPYWIDFTFDQFIDYKTTRNWKAHLDERPQYAGILMMPIDATTLRELRSGRR